MWRKALHSKWPRDPDPLRILAGLVIEQFVLDMPPDCRVDLFAAHPFFYVRVIRNRLQRDVLYTFVDEAMADIVCHLGRRQGRARKFALLPAAFDRVCEKVPREPRPHESLSRECKGHPGCNATQPKLIMVPGCVAPGCSGWWPA